MAFHDNIVPAAAFHAQVFLKNIPEMVVAVGETVFDIALFAQMEFPASAVFEAGLFLVALFLP